MNAQTENKDFSTGGSIVLFGPVVYTSIEERQYERSI